MGKVTTIVSPKQGGNEDSTYGSDGIILVEVQTYPPCTSCPSFEATLSLGGAEIDISMSTR